jgi:hypothetical protein
MFKKMLTIAHYLNILLHSLKANNVLIMAGATFHFNLIGSSVGHIGFCSDCLYTYTVI